MDKQIDIHIFGMDENLFQKLFLEKKNLININDIGIIENRQINFGIKKKKKIIIYLSLLLLNYFEKNTI